MTRKEAIKYLGWLRNETNIVEYREAIPMAIAALWEQEERRWIPVTERLPEINDKERDWSVTVLFRTIQGHIHSGYRNVGSLPQSYYDDDFTPPYWLDESENLDFDEDEVTHWMPLPEPPVEDEK